MGSRGLSPWLLTLAPLGRMEGDADRGVCAIQGREFWCCAFPRSALFGLRASTYKSGPWTRCGMACSGQVSPIGSVHISFPFQLLAVSRPLGALIAACKGS
jgi:hypothetical protein